MSSLPVSTAGAQQAAAPIRYTISFPAPRTHYIDVVALVPTAGKAQVDLMMAVWTPGSYLVREFARHVEAVRAFGAGDAALPIVKTQKNRWRVTTHGAAEVRLTYRVFAHEMTVRTNWMEDDFALVNGAATYLTLVDGLHRPHQVHVELPSGWHDALTSLPRAPGGGPHDFLAADFDALVDSPILAGSPAVYEFTVDGKRHRLVNVGEAGVWDGPRSARDVEKIVRAARELWGELPYEQYLFFNLITEGSDGIEHKGSTVLRASRWATRTPEGYRDWLGLVGHEYFHAWNVKRLRPVELGPFDYEHENYTRSLWIAEGLTDYYGHLLVRRAGLETLEEYLAALSSSIRDVQTRPGRLVQPVEMAAYDAWIKQYRPDENSMNVAVDYYSKGAAIGALLDATIRRATSGAKSLDDVMQLAFRRFSGARGYTPAEFRAVASEVAGIDLAPFFHRSLETTEELDYEPLLAWYGLRFAPTPAGPVTASLGVETRADNGRLMISSVARGGASDGSGIAAEDELVAIDDFRVRADGLAERLARYRPGQRVSVMIARRDALKRYDVTLGEESRATWALERSPDATVEQRSRMEAWLAAH